MTMTTIVFASDALFVEQLRTASFSAIYACRRGGPGLDVHILDCGIDDATWNRYAVDLSAFASRVGVEVLLARHTVDMELFANCPSWTNGSKATWSRLLLAEILPEVKSCIYSDCDMLFVENPAAMLERLEASAAWMVGHRNPYGDIGPDAAWFRAHDLPYASENYVCAGLIALNLEAFRREGFVKKAFDFIARYPDPVSVDQTVLNWFCHGKTAVLDAGWGIFPHEAFAFDGELKALHYSGGFAWARVKNAYDWVGARCARRETELLNGFRTRILKTTPFVPPRAPLRHRLAGWSVLQLTRVLNALHLPLPGHPCFSEMVAQFDGKGGALARAAERLFT